MNTRMKHRAIHFIIALALGLIATSAFADESKHRIIGIGTAERPAELREVMKELPEVHLVALDVDKAEVTLSYDLAMVFPGTSAFNLKRLTAEEIEKRLDEKLRRVSQGSFSLKPLCTIPDEQLQRIEIKIAIPDCKGCRLGTYNTLVKMDGVERCSVSAEGSLLTALIDSTRTNRDALIEALKKARVQFPTP